MQQDTTIGLRVVHVGRSRSSKVIDLCAIDDTTPLDGAWLQSENQTRRQNAQCISHSRPNRMSRSCDYFALADIFLDAIIFPYNTTHHVLVFLLVLVEPTLFRKAQGSVLSNRIGMKFGKIVLQVHKSHPLTRSNCWYGLILYRWRPWCSPAACCCMQQRSPAAHKPTERAWRHCHAACATVTDP